MARHLGWFLNEDVFYHSCSKSNSDVGMTYSTISKTTRFFVLAAAAFSIVRIEWAVLPCFPMTLPISTLATLSSNTQVLSPSIDLTETCSGVVYQRLGDTEYQILHCSSSGKGSNSNCTFYR